MEYEEVIELEAQGRLLIGIDRTMAWKFYTDISASKIAENTGEKPYFEKTIVWLAFLFGPLALILSIILGFLAFGWWGTLCLTICPIIYFLYFSFSAKGGSRIFGITMILIISMAIHLWGVFNVPMISWFVIAFVFSLWLVRLLYCSSTFFLRAFVIRNKKAYEWLEDNLAIRENI